MAFTITRVFSAFGNERIVHLGITTDGAEETVETGLNNIIAFSRGHTKVNSANITVIPNKGSTSTALVGRLGISGCTTGDIFFVTCFGT